MYPQSGIKRSMFVDPDVCLDMLNQNRKEKGSLFNTLIYLSLRTFTFHAHINSDTSESMVSLLI